MQNGGSLARVVVAMVAIAGGLVPVVLALGWRAAFCGRDDEGVCGGSGLLSLQIYLALAALTVGLVAVTQIVRLKSFVVWILLEACLTGGWIAYWVVTL